MPISREAPGKKPKNVGNDAILIPKVPNSSPTNLWQYDCTIHGDKGIGKSTLASEWPDSLTFMYEPQRSDVQVRQVPDYRRKEPPLTWGRAKDYMELVTNDDSISTLIIDNADWAYEACTDYMEEEAGKPSDKWAWNDWIALKKEWAAVNNAMRYIMACKGGCVVYISHSRRRETTSLTGETKDWIVPTCTDKCWDYLKTCPIAIYYGWRGDKRVLHMTGNEGLWAGVPDGRFRDCKTGKSLNCIVAGKDPKTTFKALCEGFANKLTDFDPDPETTANINAEVEIPRKGKK